MNKDRRRLLLTVSPDRFTVHSSSGSVTTDDIVDTIFKVARLLGRLSSCAQLEADGVEDIRHDVFAAVLLPFEPDDGILLNERYGPMSGTVMFIIDSDRKLGRIYAPHREDYRYTVTAAFMALSCLASTLQADDGSFRIRDVDLLLFESRVIDAFDEGFTKRGKPSG